MKAQRAGLPCALSDLVGLVGAHERVSRVTSQVMLMKLGQESNLENRWCPG